MNKEFFDNIAEKFKKMYAIKLKSKVKPYSVKEIVELLEMGVELSKDEYNPYAWVTEYFSYQQNIILYLDSINEKWCEKYHDDRKIAKPDEIVYLPNIFIDFKNYVESLMNEEYLECQKIKDKIFISY